MSAKVRKRLAQGVALLGAALVVAGAVVFVAHGGQSGNAAAQQGAGPSEAVDTVAIRDFLYKPAAITVPAGTKIALTNEDSAPHTATSGPSPRADGLFDTGTLKKGQRKSITAAKAGYTRS